LHKLYFERRTQLNRDLRNLGEIVEPEIPADCPPLAEVDSQLSELRRQRNSLSDERAKLIGRWEAGKKAVAGSQARRTALEEEFAQLNPLVIEKTEDVGKLQKIADSLPKYVALEQEISQVQSLLNDNRAAVARLKEPQATHCPTCHQALPVEDRSEAIANLEEGIQKIEASLQERQAKLMKMPDPRAVQEKLERHRSAMIRQAEIKKELASLPDGSIPEKPDTADLDGQISILEERVAAGEEIARQVQQFDGMRQQYQQTCQRAEKLRKQVAALDRLVEYFGDKGPLKTKLIGGKLPAFRDRINEALERFGFCCAFELDPYRLVIDSENSTQQRGPLELSQLSESERYRFGIAFQVALAEATGVRMVVIARADMLLPSVRSELTELLMDSKLDQAFILSAGEPNGDGYPSIPGVRFFELFNKGGVTAAQCFSMAAELTYERVE
jgi:DNA repair exonuclease SbcCD ATPase subunit